MIKLVESDDPILHTVCDPVPHGMNVSEIVDAMFGLLQIKLGVGLAAPQVGLNERIIVVEYGAIKTAIINPVITKRPGKVVNSIDEGCLSYPGKRVTLKRHKWVTVEGFDVNWNPVKIDARTLLAFIIQHEIDHLNGITIGDL